MDDDGDKRLVGRAFVIDLELTGDTAMLTAYEAGVPRWKKSMPNADLDRLLDLITTFPARQE